MPKPEHTSMAPYLSTVTAPYPQQASVLGTLPSSFLSERCPISLCKYDAVRPFTYRWSCRWEDSAGFSLSQTKLLINCCVQVCVERGLVCFRATLKGKIWVVLNVCLIFKDTTEVFTKYPLFCAFPEVHEKPSCFMSQFTLGTVNCFKSPPLEFVPNPRAGTS